MNACSLPNIMSSSNGREYSEEMPFSPVKRGSLLGNLFGPTLWIDHICALVENHICIYTHTYTLCVYIYSYIGMYIYVIFETWLVTWR